VQIGALLDYFFGMATSAHVDDIELVKQLHDPRTFSVASAALHIDPTMTVADMQHLPDSQLDGAKRYSYKLNEQQLNIILKVSMEAACTAGY
jgi:hypothetical protein